MKIFKNILVLAVLCCSFFAAKVDAASVAIIPLINKVEFNTVEEEKVPNMIYTSETMGVLKNKSGYMLVDNNRLRHVIKENIDPYNLPTRNQLETVCRKANIDIVFAMELLNYEYNPLSITTLNSPMIKMNVKAKLVSYNRLTGKYYVKDCIDDEELDEVFTSRWDVVQESWTKMVRQEMDRITRVKKK